MQRVLLIVNPRSGSASPRTTEVIAKALAADFKLERADTTARLHASELAADAVDRGFDAVIAFGGDGTVNEAAQALVGTDIALGMLPGGTANVMARSTGVPEDPIAATAYVGARLRSGTRRRIPVGQIGDRYFLFSAGMGLDAEVVRRTEQNPESKRKWREWTFLSKALHTAFTQYRGAEPEITLEIDGEEPQRLLLVICCNARPLTYFKRWPVDACPLASLDGGLDFFGMKRVRTLTIPRIAWGVLVSRSHIKWKSGHYRHDIEGARLTADRPMPVQVDGDYLGEWTSATVELRRDALDLVV